MVRTPCSDAVSGSSLGAAAADAGDPDTAVFSSAAPPAALGGRLSSGDSAAMVPMPGLCSHGSVRRGDWPQRAIRPVPNRLSSARSNFSARLPSADVCLASAAWWSGWRPPRSSGPGGDGEEMKSSRGVGNLGKGGGSENLADENREGLPIDGSIYIVSRQCRALNRPRSRELHGPGQRPAIWCCLGGIHFCILASSCGFV